MENLKKQYHIDPVDINLSAGDVVALVGVKDTDVSKIFKRFNEYDPIGQHNNRRKKSGNEPVIQCIKSKSNLFKPYTAYENLLLTEKCLIPYSRKQLYDVINNIKKKYRLQIDLNRKIKDMTTSERIIVDLIRAYIFNADMFVLDNLISFMDYEYAKILIAMVNDIRNQNKMILYLTTKWEDAVKLASHIYVVMDDTKLGDMSSEEVKKNPQYLIYLLSGRKLVEDRDKQDETKEFLNLLNTGAEYLSNNYGLKDALAYVSSNIARILHADKAIIYLLNDETKQIHTFSDTQLQYSDELKIDFVRYHLDNDKPSDLFYATFDDTNFEQYFRNSEITCKTLLCIPIYSKSKAQGLLQIMYSRYFVYDEKHLLYIKTFCKEIAIIIETSRLMGNSVLLQESNHRIKNNLQTIVNIISMQQIFIRKNSSYDVNAILNSILDRIKNIASLHEFLTTNLRGEGSIDLKDIVTVILSSFAFRNVKINVTIDGIYVPYGKATSISMVINELITNIYKYAFHNRTDNWISIECYYSQNRNILKISDNGVGMPEKFDLNNSYSIGYSIVKSIVQIDLRGTIEVTSNSEGTLVTIIIPTMV